MLRLVQDMRNLERQRSEIRTPVSQARCSRQEQKEGYKGRETAAHRCVIDEEDRGPEPRPAHCWLNAEHTPSSGSHTPWIPSSSVHCLSPRSGVHLHLGPSPTKSSQVGPSPTYLAFIVYYIFLTAFCRPTDHDTPQTRSYLKPKKSLKF